MRKGSICLSSQTNYAPRHEGAGGSGCIDLCILDIGTSWKFVFSFKLQPLCPRYTLDRRLGGPHNRYGRRGFPNCSHTSVTATVTDSLTTSQQLNCFLHWQTTIRDCIVPSYAYIVSARTAQRTLIPTCLLLLCAWLLQGLHSHGRCLQKLYLATAVV
jgi:hypothetical protein